MCRNPFYSGRFFQSWKPKRSGGRSRKVAIPSIQVVFFNLRDKLLPKGFDELSQSLLFRSFFSISKKFVELSPRMLGRNPFYSGRFFQSTIFYHKKIWSLRVAIPSIQVVFFNSRQAVGTAGDPADMSQSLLFRSFFSIGSRPHRQCRPPRAVAIPSIQVVFFNQYSKEFFPSREIVAIPSIQVVFFNRIYGYWVFERDCSVAIPSIQVVFFNRTF